MGCLVSLPTEKQKLQMPNKIFRSSLTILSVEDEATKKLIYKNETPNTEFSPPICSFITDENDSQSMAGKLAREKNDANIKKNIFSVWWHYATSFEYVIQFNFKNRWSPNNIQDYYLDHSRTILFSPKNTYIKGYQYF